MLRARIVCRRGSEKPDGKWDLNRNSFLPQPVVLAAAAQQCPVRGLRVTAEASVACGAIGGAIAFPPPCSVVTKGVPPSRQSRGSPGAPGTPGWGFQTQTHPAESGPGHRDPTCAVLAAQLMLALGREGASSICKGSGAWMGFGASGAARAPCRHLTVLLLFWALQNP